MKKTSSNTPAKAAAKRSTTARSRGKARQASEMRAHYDFDYSKSRPNRFAERLSEGSVAIVLDPDVASVFQSSESVNAFLRSAIAAMPDTGSHKKKRTA